MPHKFPDPIAEIVKAQMPPTYKMWWVRGVALDSRQMQIPEGLAKIVPPVNTIVQVMDVDTDGDAYDMVLIGEGFDFVQGDAVSLFGHEPVSAASISSPRLIFNHNTGAYAHAYPISLFYPAGWHFADFKHRLECRITLTPAQRNTKVALVAGIFLLSGCVSAGATFIIALLLLMVGGPMLILQHTLQRAARPTFGNDSKATAESNLLKQFQDYINTKHHNVTALYQTVSSQIDIWAEEDPDPKKGFVVVHRGRGQRGKLVD